MRCLISLNKFNKIIAAATILATISCLVSESAQAISLRFSGNPNAGETFLSFTLDTSIESEFKPDGSEYFPGAVQDVIFLKCKNPNPDRREFLPNCETDKFLFDSGDLTFYRLSDNEVKYESMLFDENSNNLKLGISFTGLSNAEFITSLSDLNELLETQRPKFDARLNSPDAPLTFVNSFTNVEVAAVPEPNGANSILGIGAIGAVLLLKRTKRSRRIQGSQNSIVQNRDVAKS